MYVHSGIEAKLVRVPLNTAVVQGSAVTFECSSNDISSKLPWFNSSCVTTISLSDCREYFINSGYNDNFPTRFTVTSLNNGTHITRDLNINPTQLTDAGVYLCAELLTVTGVSINDSTSSAQLIVLGK